MPYLSLDDCKLYFEIHGSGHDIFTKPAVICLDVDKASLFSTWHFWKKLQSKVQIIFLDSRGLGRSSQSRSDLRSPMQRADDVYLFSRKLGLSRPLLAGNSFGCHIAMFAGSRYPGFWGGLILMNPETHFMGKKWTCEPSKIVDNMLFLASDLNFFPNTTSLRHVVSILNSVRVRAFLKKQAPLILKTQTTSYPKQCAQGFLKTTNKMGVTTLEKAPPTEAFIDYAYHAKKPVLDIGCGYGLSALAALKAGAHVIALDLSVEHLQVLQHNVPKSLKTKLVTQVAHFPQGVAWVENSLSAVHAALIMHFLSGDDIMDGLKKIYHGLEPGGRLFLGNMTPYTGVHDNGALITEYNKRVKQTEKWPGYIHYNKFAKTDWTNYLPEFVHFFKIETAVHMISKAGFEIDKAYYYTLDNMPDRCKTNGKEFIGIHAVKP